MTVLGRPEAPRAPRVEEVRSETVVLSWDQPNNNGADITGYTLRTNTGQEHACATTTCTFDGLKNNVKYTFTVVATNEVGDSEPSPRSREARPDEKPDKPEPPTLDFDDSALIVSWTNRSYTDRSPIECVNLEISPAPTDGVTQKTCQTGGRITWTGLENGTAYTVSVQAKNKAPDPSDWSDPSAPETPAAPPAQPAPPTATRVNTAVGGQITVEWTAPANNGDAVKEYTLTEYQDGAMTRTLKETGTRKVIQDLSTNSTYTYTVQARNKAGDSPVSGQSNEVVPYGTPDTPGTPSAALGSNTSGQANVSWNRVAAVRGTGERYEVQANGAGARDAGNTTSYTYTGLSNGTSYTFQVRACNAYICSDWSAASGAVIPYGPPPTPSISANGGDRQVTFTWDGRATNGRAIKSVRVTGAFTSSATNGSRSVSTGYSSRLEACVVVTDTENQTARKCAAATSDARPDPKATVTHGSRVSNGECSHASCAYFLVNVSDFDAGSHQVACWAGDTPEVKGWHDIISHARTWAGSSKSSYTFPANGSVQLRCFFGHPGTPVRVLIDGKEYGVTNWWNG
ncbi:Fibronectin type III domain-containing protein [Promicromonospora thailandica]|uniref:Fibronectin type III domain-containing protein n=2 Tax=Promicromonospora thailandica TaxID=765201 RepID=A0A9X2K0Y1_9MICO|nr:Fibronectin type III domain-containing protein [Promicromonospora thailandica]